MYYQQSPVDKFQTLTQLQNFWLCPDFKILHQLEQYQCRSVSLCGAVVSTSFFFDRLLAHSTMQEFSREFY